MKEQINPTCDSFCPTSWRIQAATNEANIIETKAAKSGFVVEEGYVNCDGPYIGRGNNPENGTFVFACRAICKSSVVESLHENSNKSVITKLIDEQLSHALADIFNTSEK